MAKLTFLGTGTSQGVPVVSCGCWVCTSPDTRDKRLRTSAMIETGGRRIIIDAGPDFRQQMLRENVKRIDGILLTHAHKDHIGGIDDVRAFNYTMREAVKLYATEATQRVVKKDYDYAFVDAKYPGVPEIDMRTIDPDRNFAIEEIEVVPIKGLHYRLPVLGYRIDDIAYITDFNFIEDEEIDKIKGVKVLVINALRQEPHSSHFTLDQSLHVAYKVGADRTYLTHVSHQMGRHAQVDLALPPATYFAYDGLSINTENE